MPISWGRSINSCLKVDIQIYADSRILNMITLNNQIIRNRSYLLNYKDKELGFNYHLEICFLGGQIQIQD